MIRLLAFSVLAIFLFLGGQASAQVAACGDRGSIAEKLDDGYSELPVAMGLSANGSVVEVFASMTGTFTIIVTQPDGMSCILVTGESWEGIGAMKADLKI
ncbi:MAG: hypothetical protein HN403_20025 [Rhodospirillales bacterium]|jgi:hypothetical protein|nr:hypothetical protein [Rhodospirillales bacterium]